MGAILKVLPTDRAGKKPKYRTGSEVLRLFPTAVGSGATNVIYAIAFKGDVVKVGRSRHPRERLATHWRSAKGEVLWLHMFEPMHRTAARHVESEVPKVFADHARRIQSSEWYFSDAPKAQVIALLRPLIARCKENFLAQVAAAKTKPCPHCGGPVPRIPWYADLNFYDA